MNINKFHNRVLIALLLSAPSYSILYMVRGYDFSGMTLYSHIEYSATVFVIIFLLFELHTHKSDFLENHLSWKQHFKLRVLSELAVTILITPFIVSAGMYLLYVSMWEMSLGITSYIEYVLFALPFSALIAVFVNSDQLVEEWKNSLLENEILEKENTRAKMRILQSQISPHFLFNNFNVLGALIEEDPRLARDYLEKLSMVYRYVISNKNEELVELRNELDFIADYVYLLRIRFNKNLHFVCDVNGHASAKIPPATLQILIENAVKHNEISTRKPLMISVTASSDDTIRVMNNLQPRSNSESGTGVGLKNIIDRYKFYSDRPVQVLVESERFIVELPILNMQQS